MGIQHNITFWGISEVCMFLFQPSKILLSYGLRFADPRYKNCSLILRLSESQVKIHWMCVWLPDAFQNKLEIFLYRSLTSKTSMCECDSRGELLKQSSSGSLDYRDKVCTCQIQATIIILDCDHFSKTGARCLAHFEWVECPWISGMSQSELANMHCCDK